MRYNFSVSIILFFALSGNALAQNYRIDSLLNILPKVEKGKVRIDVLNKIAFLYTVVSIGEAEKYVNESIQASRETGYKSGLAEAFKVLGIIYQVRSEYSLAMEYYYQSLKLYEALNDKSGQSKVLNNLALSLISQKEYGRAYDLSTQSLRLKREIGDSLGVANSVLTLAEFYRHSGDFNKALEFSKAALARFRSLKNHMGSSHAYFTMGDIYLSQWRYPFAAGYYHDAIRFARLADDHIQIINANKQLGKLFLESEKFDSAYVYLRNTLRLATGMNNRTNEMEARQYLAEYFTKVNKLDSALHYTHTASVIEREIFNNQKQEQIATLQMLYDFEKKEQELAFQKKIVQKQYAAIVGGSLVLVLSVLFAFRVYSLNRANQQAKESLIKLNAEIKKINENLEGIVFERTEEIKLQNQKLIEYAFFTAHEVRGPLARILGLIELAKIKELSEEDKQQIMIRLEDASTELDEIIRTINRKLESSRRF